MIQSKIKATHLAHTNKNFNHKNGSIKSNWGMGQSQWVEEKWAEQKKYGSSNMVYCLIKRKC